MANIYSVAVQAIDVYKRLNDAAKYILPEDIEKIVKKHAAIAVATAFIPIGGLDMVAATANVWTMYVRINNALGVKFSDNKMKSIGSAVVSNLVQNLGITAVAVALKWNHFISGLRRNINGGFVWIDYDFWLGIP
ncbi:MAG: DUF697 domain-containing protein [Prevotellaceae bacterium]|nr:DUF697 domain-containing protein [Prevotellaceae bacterium]